MTKRSICNEENKIERFPSSSDEKKHHHSYDLGSYVESEMRYNKTITKNIYINRDNNMIKKTSDSFKRYIPQLIIGPMLKMIEAVFDLLIPLFMKSIIDLSRNAMMGLSPLYGMNAISRGISSFLLLFGNWVESPTLNYALIGGTFILLMGILGFLTTMITQYVAAKTAINCGCDIRDALYRKILSLGKQDRENFGNSKLLTILNSDTYQVQQGVLIFIRLIVRAPFLILGALVFSFLLNWKIGLIFLTIIPLIAFVIFGIMKKSSERYLFIQGKLDDLSTKTSDSLQGAKVIRAFSTQEREEKNFNKKADAYYEEALGVQKLNAWINPLTFSIISLATCFVVLFGAMPIFESSDNSLNTQLASTIITEISYLLQIFTTLVQLTNVIMILTKASVSMKRIDEVFAIKEKIQEKEGAISSSLEPGELLFDFDHVSFSYKEGGNEALKDLNFRLEKGKSLGIIGGTGSGKSTLIYLMLRLVDASKGKVLYKGKDIKDYPLHALRKEQSFVPQKSVLFKGTIRSNLLMANENATEESMIQALKDSKAYEFVSKYDDFLDHEVEEGGRNFSGGQRQRLCIARALMVNPEVIILDDSTSALDLLTDYQVRKNIHDRFVNTSKVIVSQRVSTVKDCDLILVLEGGRIIAQGDHETLLNTCEVYQSTYESQTKKEAD